MPDVVSALVPLVACGVLLAFAQAAVSDEDAIARLVSEHVRRHPRLEVQDLYKLLHQAALGSEHAVADLAAARQWMAHEIAALGPGLPEPLVEPVSPDGRLARVHLRPYLKAGHDPERLVEAFILTASEYKGAVSELERYGRVATRMAAAGHLPFPAEEVTRFFEAQAAQGHPAARHSAAYRQAYAPAYRVVALEHLALSDD
jgi:hypothetical protein